MTGVSISKKLATTVGPTEFAQQQQRQQRQQQQQQQQKQHTYCILGQTNQNMINW